MGGGDRSDVAEVLGGVWWPGVCGLNLRQCFPINPFSIADVAELADAQDSGSCAR